MAPSRLAAPGANEVFSCVVKWHEKCKPSRPPAGSHGCQDPTPLEEALGCEGNQKQRVTSKSDPTAPVVRIALTVTTDYSKYIAAIRFHLLPPRLPHPPSPEKEQPKEKNKTNRKKSTVSQSRGSTNTSGRGRMYSILI